MVSESENQVEESYDFIYLCGVEVHVPVNDVDEETEMVVFQQVVFEEDEYEEFDDFQ